MENNGKMENSHKNEMPIVNFKCSPSCSLLLLLYSTFLKIWLAEKRVRGTAILSPLYTQTLHFSFCGNDEELIPHIVHWSCWAIILDVTGFLRLSFVLCVFRFGDISRTSARLGCYWEQTHKQSMAVRSANRSVAGGILGFQVVINSGFCRILWGLLM